MKKATKIVSIVSLILDYAILAAAIIIAIYSYLNFGNIVEGAVDNAMSASHSGGAAASASMTPGQEAVGKAAAGFAVGLFGAIGVFFLICICVIVALYMIFPIVTMHRVLKKLAVATCRKDMVRIGVVSLFAFQIVAGIMLISMPDKAYIE